MKMVSPLKSVRAGVNCTTKLQYAQKQRKAEYERENLIRHSGKVHEEYILHSHYLSYSGDVVTNTGNKAQPEFHEHLLTSRR